MMKVYFDNSFTTKPSEEVVDIMVQALTVYYGNPSSLHRMGLEVEKKVKNARRQVSRALGSFEQEIIFTSGGTEANNMAISGAVTANKRKGNTVITTKIEHPSVLNVFKHLESIGFNVFYLNVDNSGKINLDELYTNLTPDTVLVSIMHVNNEIGVIQPVEEIGNIIKKNNQNTVFHIDAIQSFGKVPLNPSNLKADLISLSGHKVHGPKGIGALYIRKGLNLTPIIYGGNQESGIRSGTENIPGILGLGVAAESIYNNLKGNITKIEYIKKSFIKAVQLEIEDILFNGPVNEEGAPHILNISFLGTRGEVLLHLLEQDDIYVSTGSACSSKKDTKSHVLKAIGLKDQEIEGAIRFSFTYNNTVEEVSYVVDRLKKHVKDLRKIIKR